jgi:hypothetical protein
MRSMNSSAPTRVGTNPGTARLEPTHSMIDNLPPQAEPPNERASRDVVVELLDPELLRRAKPAFTTRRVPREVMRTLVTGRLRPRSGDLVLACVDRIRHQKRVELPNGRKASLFNGDHILVAYADRYATDQFESHVPPDLGPTHLVATGGVASRMLSRSRKVRDATEITPLGLVGDARGIPINLSDFALPPVQVERERPPTIVVVGTSMNSGKTTTIQNLVRGLSLAGQKPGTTKATGTGSGGDYWVMVDSGAHKMLDFTDVGLASTFRIPLRILERKLVELVDHLTAADSGVILVEIADGLFQQETARLIQSRVFCDLIDGVVFAAGDAMSATTGVALLHNIGLPVIGVSGLVSASPLASREAEAAAGVPVLTKEELADPEFARVIAGTAAWFRMLKDGKREKPDALKPFTLESLLNRHAQAPRVAAAHSRAQTSDTLVDTPMRALR